MRLIFFSIFWPLFTSPAAEPPALPDADRFNYVLGTQAIGGKYQFTDQPALIEAARVMREMGASTIKFALSPEHFTEDIRTVTDLVSRDPVYRQVLDMPFAHFQMWVNARAEGAWVNGLKPRQVIEEYRQVYDLTVHLLKTYSGTSKTFYLGHWEGDNMLRGDIGDKGDAKMADPVRVEGFIDWLGIRQQAVVDAKRDTPHRDVQVWHYTEVNHPTISLLKDRPTLANRVLPFVPVDFISYSAYDSQSDPKLLRDTLDYLQSRLQPRSDLPGRRVFIGEYGFWTRKDGLPQNTPVEQNQRSLAVIRTALDWGCPFILYWQLYNNETDPDGGHRGFWMIDDQGIKQPIYKTHQDYFKWARQHVAGFKARTSQPPTEAEFRRAALDYFRPPATPAD
jgi:hypothetical protein